MATTAAFPGFKLRLTRWGAVYLVFVLVLGFAAVNTGNNALMATLGLCLAAYVVSGTWSRQVLGNLALGVRPPAEVFAGRPALFEVEIRNPSRFFPAYGVVLRRPDGGQVLVEALVPAGATVRRSVEVVLPYRGWVGLADWTVEILLPLGFFAKSKRIGGTARALVFPALLGRAALKPGAGHGRRASERWRPRGREGEVTQLRTYQEGDELRQIHWKQSARQQDLIAMDRERQAEAPVLFVVDPRLADPTNEDQKARFERLLSEVTTGVVENLSRGFAVGVVVGAVAAGPFSQRSALAQLLTPLAEAEALPAEQELELALSSVGEPRLEAAS